VLDNKVPIWKVLDTVNSQIKINNNKIYMGSGKFKTMLGFGKPWENRNKIIKINKTIQIHIYKINFGCG
jgi:hypothetical protein